MMVYDSDFGHKKLNVEAEESGMKFTFKSENFFPIEALIKSQQGDFDCVKTCEWVICPRSGRMEDKILFIEAKTSAPNCNNCQPENIHSEITLSDSNWKLLSPFDIYIREICQKFLDSYSLWQSLHDGNHETLRKSLPGHAHKCSKQRTPVFILVIKNFKEEWLQPILDEIKKQFRHFLRVWDISPTAIKVVTPRIAEEQLHLNVKAISEAQ